MGNFNSGKLLFFGHDDLFSNNCINRNKNNHRFISNTLQWMCGSKSSIKAGLLFQHSDWPQEFSLKTVNKKVKTFFVENQHQLNDIDILCVHYYRSYPESLTAEMLDSIKSFVSEGGNLIFATHGWVWGSYGDGVNTSLTYEKDYSNYRIA